MNVRPSLVALLLASLLAGVKVKAQHRNEWRNKAAV